MGVSGVNWTEQQHVRLLGSDVQSTPVASKPVELAAMVGPAAAQQPAAAAGSAAAGSAAAGKATIVNPGTGIITRWPGQLTRRQDVIGFGDQGVWTAASNGDGTFQPPQLAEANMGVQQGWQVDKHPRFAADVTGDGRADLVGFGDAGVWTALSSGGGSFQPSRFVLENLGVQQGWQVALHLRLVADVTGDGRADLVGFGDAGVWTAVSSGDGSFQAPRLVVADMGVQQGWQVAKHPRFVADVTGDGRGDLVGFGDAGVWTAISNGDGSFQAPKFVLANMGVQQGWQVGLHPRFVADVTGDGRADLVGFGDAGVWVAVSNGDGSFQAPQMVVANMCVQQGWQVPLHPRFAADVTGDGRADLVGFGDAGVWTAVSKGDGTFQAPKFVLANMGVQQGWQVAKHPRFVADVTGDGRGDLVGFGDAGVWTAVSNGDGSFRGPDLGVTDFGAASGTAGVKHVFVLMLENRAFDHMLGFSQLSGTDAVTGQPTTATGLSGKEQNVVNGTAYPVTAGAENVMALGPGHEFEDVLTQLAGAGASYPSGGPYPAINDSGYAASFSGHGGSPAEVMKCFTVPQLPVLNQLAQEFAVCDRWFSSLPGPTFPNRFFVHAASSGGLDHSPSDWENFVWESVDGFDFPNGSIYNALDNAGLSYRFYAGDWLPVVAALSGVWLWDIHSFDDFAGDLSNPDYAGLHYVHLEPSYDINNDFRSGSSQHPLGDIVKGEQFIKQAYEAIRNSPLWEDSLLIITWDEHGGFFDHVTPPKAIPPGDGTGPGHKYNQHGFAFDQLGPRVPAIVISPRIPKNVIDHRTYDHASVPAAIERIFGMAPLTDRDKLVNAPNSLLTLASPRTDTPATLVSPAAEAAVTALAQSAAQNAAKLAQPVADPSVVPFLQTAVIADLKMADASQKQAIVANAQKITTYGEAYSYIQSVMQRASVVTPPVLKAPVAAPVISQVDKSLNA
jgi:phospholipase C